MNKLNHLSDTDMEVFKDHLSTLFMSQIMDMRNEVFNIVTENNMCHHNLMDMCSSITFEIFDGVISMLPQEVQNRYDRDMKTELHLVGMVFKDGLDNNTGDSSNH